MTRFATLSNIKAKKAFQSPARNQLWRVTVTAPSRTSTAFPPLAGARPPASSLRVRTDLAGGSNERHAAWSVGTRERMLLHRPGYVRLGIVRRQVPVVGFD